MTKNNVQYILVNQNKIKNVSTSVQSSTDTFFIIFCSALATKYSLNSIFVFLRDRLNNARLVITNITTVNSCS